MPTGALPLRFSPAGSTQQQLALGARPPGAGSRGRGEPGAGVGDGRTGTRGAGGRGRGAGCRARAEAEAGAPGSRAKARPRRGRELVPRARGARRRRTGGLGESGETGRATRESAEGLRERNMLGQGVHVLGQGGAAAQFGRHTAPPLLMATTLDRRKSKIVRIFDCESCSLAIKMPCPPVINYGEVERSYPRLRARKWYRQIMVPTVYQSAVTPSGEVEMVL